MESVTMALDVFFIQNGNILSSAAISLLIAIISIFDGIEENYRWFILNQVIWDALMSLQFTCLDVIGFEFYDDKRCREFMPFLVRRIPSAAYPSDGYASLLLLSFSRFLCLYFSHFYEKFTKGRRIFVTIFVYNFIIIATNLQDLFDAWQTSRGSQLTMQAGGPGAIGIKSSNPNSKLIIVSTNQQIFKNDFLYQALGVMKDIQIFTTHLKPLICLLLSIFATIMIIAKISKQFKFQFKNNKKDFYISLRITVVIAFQTLLYSIYFLIEGIYDISAILLWFWVPFDLKFYFGAWCLGEHGLCSESMRQNLMEIRILIESFIILFVMSGYREAVIRFFRMIFTKMGFTFFAKSKTPVTFLHSAEKVRGSHQ